MSASKDNVPWQGEATELSLQPPAKSDTAPVGLDVVDNTDHDGENSRSETRTKVRLGAILAALYLALFVAALDQTIISTAIPTIAHQLHSSSGYSWIASSYLLANAAAGPIWAKFSDIWGRKPALLGAVVLFMVASIIGALSSSTDMLIAARAVQGAAGGGLIQLVNITISDLFSMRQRTLYLGLVNVVWGLAGGIGPLIGGAFTEYVSWRWIFWINLPISGSSFILLFIFLDVHNPRTRIKDGILAFDWLGTISIVGVTLMLLLGLDFGGVTFPWDSPTVICLIIFGIVMIGIFLLTEKRIAKYPLMPFEIFRNRSTNAAFAVCFCHGFCFIAAWFYLPLYLQAVKQASPLRSGLLILAVTLPEASVGFVNAFVMLKTGHYREIISIGLVLLTIANGLYISLKPDTPIATLIGFEFLGGLGSGCLFEAPMVAMQSVTAQEATAAATATFGFTRNIATAVSLVLGSVVFQNGMAKRSADLRAAGLNETLVKAFSDARAEANVELVGTIANPMQQQVVKDAYARSLSDMWILFTCVAGVGLVASAFIVHRPLSTEHTETRTGLGIKEKKRDTNEHM